jgi:hypothetical protein
MRRVHVRSSALSLAELALAEIWSDPIWSDLIWSDWIGLDWNGWRGMDEEEWVEGQIGLQRGERIALWDMHEGTWRRSECMAAAAAAVATAGQSDDLVPLSMDFGLW